MKMNQKTRHLTKAASATPTPAQMEAINRFTVETLAAEDVYVRTAYLAHNGIDRDRESFDPALLRDFVRTLAGKGLFIRHPGGWDGDSGPGVGRWFEAALVEMSIEEARAALREPELRFPPDAEKAILLEASFYLPRTDSNADLITGVDAGVVGDVSIGFRAATRTTLIDGDGQEIGMRLHGPGEALEGSLVWMGAQPGARITKAAGENTPARPASVEDLSNPLKNPAQGARPHQTVAQAEAMKALAGHCRGRLPDVDPAAPASDLKDWTNPLINPALRSG